MWIFYSNMRPCNFQMHQAEMEEVRQREANLTALAAIGPRKKRKVEPGDSAGVSLILAVESVMHVFITLVL